MTGRHGLERQNEYFIPGDGISREVIQADICRYLGNDALVRPGTHNGRHGYLIRAYRNLTSEMIADLKADSARWEAEVARRADMGYSRGTYDHDVRRSRSPNTPPASYASSSIHELRQQGGPSPPTYATQPAQFMDPYGQAHYGAPQNPASAYATPPNFPSSQSPYGQGQNPYATPPQNPYSGANQPPVSAPDVHPSAYTYTSSTGGYGYEGRNTAPRYPGPGYEADPEYSPVTSSMGYPPATTAPGMAMDPRYAPEATYPDPRTQTNRPQQTRGPDSHRRTR